jgi:uroporphyrin-III C-methyltransferase
MRGKVYLVGAGPGDPEFLTIKAARLLENADVVLHDALVSEEILALARPHALMVDVGKRVGDRNISQQQINRMLVQFATSASTVVRLKGGDPSIFGRAAEETAVLRAAGIAFEIVPGVTAAVAASAGAQIPLTDRESASAVVLLTAQQATGKGAIDIARFAATGATLAIYMPNGRYREIAGQARAAGLSPQTPCLIVSNASCRQQEMQWTDIAGLALLSQPEVPAILIVGEVARCPEEVIPAIALHALQEVRSEIQTQNSHIRGER